MKRSLPEYVQVTRDFYQANAEQYAANTDIIRDEEWLLRFSALLPEGGLVLDVGCAAGRDAAWFESHGFRVTGIDVTEKFIEMASARVPAGEFRVIDVRALDFPPATFDGVWCSCVLIHLTKADAALAVDNLRRLLKPHGVLYILVKSGNKEGYEADPRYGNMKKYTAYFSDSELNNMLQSFEILAKSTVDNPADAYRTPERTFVLARKKDIVAKT